ncbi:MAG: YdeI/OmpD-associated family protein [Acidobacteria bacterium]|nr:YdeI/OmpD-associated family protein [Acidobacteriota bacterium]
MDFPVNSFSTQQAFLDWLEENGTTSTGIWLRFAKKGSGLASVSYPEAVDAALCYGWIDGKVMSESETAYRQRYTPRGKRSIWSKINREKVAALIAAGRMRPAGMAEVERAQADGRWDAAYDSPKTAAAPPELLAALVESPKATAAYAALSSMNRYSILFRLQTAKKAETRARRIAAFVATLKG